ncbi:hypothetical protein HDU97_005046 [Phlyctochytrium planicorne]|nr:hypothetical protein HDU97_005046 [Phlyctochytrium planicorne]
MGRSGRIMFCNFLFWSKVFAAVLISTAGLAYFAWKVYDLRQYALNNPSSYQDPAELNYTATQNAPIAIPTNADGSIAADCSAGQSGLARLEPPNGKMLIGYHLNWKFDTPSKIKSRINNRSPAVINAFVQLNMDNPEPFDFDLLAWHGAEVKLIQGMLELTIEPVTDIDGIPDSLYDKIAQKLRDVNVAQGVPILLRFGHEMNGDWVIAYGYRPLAYRRAFIKMTNAVRKYTNLTAMVWAPNVGLQYPFNAASDANSAKKPDPGTPEFIALDTDKNGKIAMGDDPYLPFYPGDEYVDWVGLSIYFYPEENYQDRAADKLLWNSEVPRDTYFREQMNLERLDYQVPAPFFSDPNFIALQNFYKRFCVDKNKPMLIPETGAPFILADSENTPTPARKGELAIKSAWWTQLLNVETIKAWPKLKLIVQFEETKLQAEKYQNWAVTNASNSEVLNAYNNYLSQHQDILTFGTDMKYTCDGAIKFN